MLCVCSVTMEELQNDEEYTDILEDMKEECSKYGQVNQVRGLMKGSRAQGRLEEQGRAEQA